tara:strand:- start:470 stop:1183 length:714 start_codon:yes stop_codon:yes gene_type:complete
MKNNTLIIGCSSGIGLNSAKYFLQKGHNVIGLSRNNVNIKNKKFKLIKFDLLDFNNYEEMFKKLVNPFGKINNLLFSAGVQYVKPISIIENNDFDNIIKLNLESPILFSKFVSNKNYFSRPGSAVFISSVIAIKPSSGQSLYSASKSGIINHVKTLALEVSKYKINVNAISPGMINSPMLKKYSNSVTKDFLLKTINQHPLGLGKFEDITNAVNFLFDPSSKWITGTNLIVDGGYSI